MFYHFIVRETFNTAGGLKSDRNGFAKMRLTALSV